MDQTEYLGSFYPEYENISRSSTDTVYAPIDDNLTVPAEEKASDFSSLKVSCPNNYMIKTEIQQYADSDAGAFCPNSQPQKPKLKKVISSRVNFSPEQIIALENMFSLCKYLPKPQRIKLADKISLDEHKILIWFQNRRVKEKKMNTKGESSIKKNAKKCETKEQNKHDSSFVTRPLQHGGWPTVSSLPVPSRTYAEAIPKVPEWHYQDFHPSAYPTFNHVPQNSWRDGYYGHGQYWPNDFKYYDGIMH